MTDEPELEPVRCLLCSRVLPKLNPSPNAAAACRFCMETLTMPKPTKPEQEN